MDLQHESMVNDLFVISKQINKSTTYQSKVMNALLYVFVKDGFMYDPEDSIGRIMNNRFNDILLKNISNASMKIAKNEFIEATLIGKFNHMQATAFLESIKHEMEA